MHPLAPLPDPHALTCRQPTQNHGETPAPIPTTMNTLQTCLTPCRMNCGPHARAIITSPSNEDSELTPSVAKRETRAQPSSSRGNLAPGDCMAAAPTAPSSRHRPQTLRPVSRRLPTTSKDGRPRSAPRLPTTGPTAVGP
eukprot:2178859-Pleurochrysis_carterae.AAC.1